MGWSEIRVRAKMGILATVMTVIQVRESKGIPEKENRVMVSIPGCMGNGANDGGAAGAGDGASSVVSTGNRGSGCWAIRANR